MKPFYVLFVAILIPFICIGIGAWIVQLLWNWLMPTLFQLPEISYLQALGISFLCGLLFGGGRYNSSKK